MSRRQKVFGRETTPGQAKSKARKQAAKQEKQARLRSEATRRGISVHQVPYVLHMELLEATRLRRQRVVEEQRRSQQWDPYARRRTGLYGEYRPY